MKSHFSQVAPYNIGLSNVLIINACLLLHSRCIKCGIPIPADLPPPENEEIPHTDANPVAVQQRSSYSRKSCAAGGHTKLLLAMKHERQIADVSEAAIC
ncbi:uncharacterized protein LOC135092785 isoform X2 [Scylla paramamosain]|uniref:uncharacterized protein LOC135092785 isoform X2 n=1 Tax=Scylla paramamosain TaxID=85552 RepID=UPI003082CE80